MKLQRVDIVGTFGGGTEIFDCEEGEWVDADLAQAEVDRLEAELEAERLRAHHLLGLFERMGIDSSADAMTGWAVSAPCGVPSFVKEGCPLIPFSSVPGYDELRKRRASFDAKKSGA